MTALTGGSARADIQGTNWFPIGPAPISGFFAGGVSGRGSAIAVNDFNPDDVWLGTPAGGVWHSTDGGKHWKPMSDDEPSLAIGALALQDCSPGGCAVIYAGTGENNIRRDTYYGAGLLIGSTSGGEFPTFSWDQKTGTPLNFSGGSINNVILDPNTSGASTRIYVSLSSGVTVSSTEATVTAPEPMPGGFGIYKSEDRGDTWTELMVAGSGGARPTDLELDPEDANVLYAGFLGKGVFKSTNKGATWCPLNPGLAVPGCTPATGLPNAATPALPFDTVEVAIFPGDSATLYAMFGHCPDPLLNECQPSIFKSTDGGATWQQRMLGSATPGDITVCPFVYSRYTHTLAVHPTNSNTVFLSGGRLCKSTDGGQTFAAADNNSVPGGSPWGPILHLDHHAVVIHPTQPSRMYDTSDGGFAYSTDGGQSWRPGNDDLSITGFQSIASSPLTGRVIGAAQDNRAQMWKGNRTWQSICGSCGDGGFTIMDLDDVMRMYAGQNFGSLRRSTDGGTSFQPIGNIPSTEPRLFYVPIVQDPSAPHPLYYGGSRLFRSMDDGGSWTVVSPVFSTTPQPEIVTGSAAGSPGVNVITAIAIAPSNANRIYVGLYGGEIFTSGAPCTTMSCWTKVSSGLPAAPVTRIAVDPGAPGTAYATFSGFGTAAHVWKTTNAGGAWSPISSGLPGSVPANTITVEPGTPANLWLGLDSGPDGSSVFKSTNGGATWSAFSNGLPNAPVYEISIDGTRGRVYAATHGRGAFVISRPFLSNFEGWVNNQIWDIPVYGQNFLPPAETCTMDILRQDGTICASGSVDAMGGTIKTDDNGVLVTSKGGFYNGKPVAWACFNGTCVNNTSIASCNTPGNPVTTVLVTCGGEVAIDNILGCPQITNPPSTLMGISGLPGPGPLVTGGVETQFVMDLTAGVQSGDGTTHSLCTVSVPFEGTDDVEEVLAHARAAIDDSPTCAANTVRAFLEGAADEQDDASEDEFPHDPQLRISAVGAVGGQLYTAMHLAPGHPVGPCLVLNGLGVPVLNQIQVAQMAFQTMSGGASGGEITVIQHTTQGTCAITVPTSPGDSAGEIAQAIEDAVQAPGIPGPHPECPADRNPRDIRLDGDRLVTVFSADLHVCVNDPGVGVTIGPEELLASHPVADAGPDRSVPCTAASGASVTLDATGSSDPDSTPGTNDDIVKFEWFENFGEPSERALGQGESLDVDFAPGSHTVTLRVTDAGGLTALDSAVIVVTQAFHLTMAPAILWPPDHRLVNTKATLEFACGAFPVQLASIDSSQADGGTGPADVPNDVQGADFGGDDRRYRLRAEHAPATVREYTITYAGLDVTGNTVREQATVRVPKSGATVISRNRAAADGDSASPALSTDGGVVAFVSNAANLVPHDTNQVGDVFVRDRAHDTVERVSVSGLEAQANGPSRLPAISGDGELVAFTSLASNLVAGDGNNRQDVFARNRGDGTTERISVSTSGAEGAGASGAPSISEDGRFVAFQSLAANLVAGDTNGASDVFVRDRVTQSTERICGTRQGDRFSIAPAISADGTVVAFASAATNLVPGDDNARVDIFVCDRGSGALERVSVASDGRQANRDSFLPAISRDGRFVAFKSLADNLVPGDHNGVVDVFVRDRVAGTTERVSVNGTGGDADDASFPPRMSHDGRFVVFGSFATNLVAADANALPDVFVRDRETGRTFLVDVDGDGAAANGGAADQPAAISGDGVQVGFASVASNLAGRDTGVSNVFVVCNPALPTAAPPLIASDHFDAALEALRRRMHAAPRISP